MSVKAFELAPVLESMQLMGDKARITIECVETCGKHLYLGTNDSFIIQYALEEKQQPNGRIVYNCFKECHKYLGIKKPIQEMKAASALNRILISCDNCLFLINMDGLEPISGSPKIKGITSFCVNENPHSNNPFSVQICIAKKKQLQIYTITEDKAIHIKDINLPDPPVVMAMDGIFVCAAMTSQYAIINCDTCFVQDLFPYDASMTVPFVKRIGREEFLLSGPNALGMFVTAAGISERPPIQWSERLYSAAYFHPYVLAMDNEFISVFSVLDQQQKQNLQFQGGHCLGNYDGKLFIASRISIYAAVPIPWEKQVQALLSNFRINEAIELAQNANRVGLTKEQFSKVFQKIQQQAGFLQFSQFLFDEARELFRSGQLDVRELISLYPNLLPASSNFSRAVPALHNIADISQMCKGDENEISQCKKFLMEYLELIRGTQSAADHKLEVDTALLKLYAEVDSGELTTLIVASNNEYDLKECAEWLERCQRYSALGLFYKYHSENEKALKVWMKIISEEYKDENFGGLNFFIEFLANLNDFDLVWKYVDFVLEKDQVEGVKVFTERPPNEEPSERMKPDNIIEYLHKYPKAVIKYLEYLVFIKKLEKEKFHTHLAVLYLDKVLELLKTPDANPEELAASRKCLQELLQFSNLYRVQLLLGKVRDSELHLEAAILFGKLEEHEKALRILVHQLNDFASAENYCIKNSENKDVKYSQRLFHILLTVYLDPKQNPRRREELLQPALRLLNSEDAEFNTSKVLQLIPEEWSVAIIDKFLRRSLRKALHIRRTKQIECKLRKGENVQVKFMKYDIERVPIVMTEDRLCSVCSRPFVESTFACNPNGTVTHPQCSRSTVSSSASGKLLNSSNFSNSLFDSR